MLSGIYRCQWKSPEKIKRADLKYGLPSYSRMEVNLFLMFHGSMIIKTYEEIMNGMRRIYEKLPEAT